MTAAILRANRRTFVSLRKHRNYRLFFSGQVVSVSGTWMQNIATAWLVLELTHSPVAVGVLALCQFLPFTVLGLFAGVLVDRLDAHRTVIATQTAAMLTAVVLTGLTLTGSVTVMDVYVLTALRGIVLVLDAPARQALTFAMVGRDELPNAVALNSSLFNAARAVGPAVGGVMVAAAGVGACFAFNAVSYVAVLAGLVLMRRPELFEIEKAAEPPTVLRGTGEALAYVWRTPTALVALSAVFVLSTLSFNFNVLLPVLAGHTLSGGPGVFGVITAAFGVGALVGALLSASMARASWTALVLGSLGFGVAQLLLAPLHSVLGACILLCATGMCFTLWSSNANSALQLAAPSELRGRVIGLYYFAFNGSGPAGGMLAGWLAAVGGTALAFGVSGAAAVAVGGVALAVLRHRISAPRQPASREATSSATRSSQVSVPETPSASPTMAAVPPDRLASAAISRRARSAYRMASREHSRGISVSPRKPSTTDRSAARLPRDPDPVRGTSVPQVRQN